ncbi:hypothetical protein O7634_26560 [Micromonospora sp. WMMD1120]|uniref:hypothetical protein n=1 Tax=Micromonospora sp. WMMD1120 TaxID=3016106 RepID=UPI0024172D23|nr:hypothetical protein [Micromonospora sp. WMMD1120]MDG4810331.1 hypothetical protein [Micromonospora sp. WMMD1120]
MPPRRHPRSWLAGRLRSAAAAVQRLAGRVEPADHPLPAPTDPPPGRPRRFGEPPQHWLDLVAAHAPGLLRDLRLDQAAADAADPHGWPDPGGPADPGGHRPAPGDAVGPTDPAGDGSAGAGRTPRHPVDARDQVGAPTASGSHAADAGRHVGAPEGAAGPGRSPGVSRPPVARPTRPRGRRFDSTGARATPTGPDDPRRPAPSGSAGSPRPRPPSDPDGSHHPNPSSGTDATRRPGPFSAPHEPPRPSGSATSRPDTGDAAVEGAPDRPVVRAMVFAPYAVRADQSRSRTSYSGELVVDGGPARSGPTVDPVPGGRHGFRDGPERAAARPHDPGDTAGRQRKRPPDRRGAPYPDGADPLAALRAGPTTGRGELTRHPAGPWPALADEPAATGRRAGAAGAAEHGWWHGDTPPAAEARAVDRWPALPDDAILWTTPGSVPDAARSSRLDEEQAAG